MTEKLPDGLEDKIFLNLEITPLTGKNFASSKSKNEN